MQRASTELHAIKVDGEEAQTALALQSLLCTEETSCLTSATENGEKEPFKDTKKVSSCRNAPNSVSASTNYCWRDKIYLSRNEIPNKRPKQDNRTEIQ